MRPLGYIQYGTLATYNVVHLGYIQYGTMHFDQESRPKLAKTSVSTDHHEYALIKQF